MNQITKLAFFDELTKISARWREALRMGEIGAPEIKRLRGAKLLNYNKEIRGLNRGSKNLMDKYDLEMGPPLRGSGGMQGRFNVEDNTIHMRPTYKGKTMTDRRAARAIAKRHEVDEARLFHNSMCKVTTKIEKNKDPSALIARINRQPISSHVGPSVTAREHRNVRMLPPSADTGSPIEYGFNNALMGKAGPGALSRKDMKKIDKRFSNASQEEISSIAAKL